MNKNRFFTLIVNCALCCLIVPLTLQAQNLQPVAFKDAVNRALRSSREVALAQARYDVAEREIGVNRSAFQPNLFTGSGAAYTYGFPLTPGGAAPSIINLSYIQAIYNPAQTAQVRAAQERKEIQRLELEKTRNSIALQASSSYLELGKVRHSLELMRNQRQSNTRILSFTQQRVREGYELPIEAKKAEVAAARTEYQIAKLESRESELQQQLAALMGIPRNQRIEVDTDSLHLETTEREQDVVDRAVETSIDLRQSEFDRRAKEHLVAGQVGTKWPTVDAVGEYGLFGRYNNFQNYYRQFQANNFTIGFQIKIPLVSAQRSSNVAFARSQMTASEMELRNKRESVELEASRQYHRLRELDAAREVARLEMEEAQENVKIIQARFEEGRANIRDISFARVEENDKFLAFLDVDFDRQKAQLDLLNITGDLSKIYQ
jgi:outer membrane protein TolC